MNLTDQQKAELVTMWAIWRRDWCLFATQVLGASLDSEQQNILRSVQHNPRTSVASGTARGKDFVTAVAALCFLYLTPEFSEPDAQNHRELIGNTKVALTAPTGRQIKNIMRPEFSRLFNRANKKLPGILPGRLVGEDIRVDGLEEWFLTGFHADPYHHEGWSGFHAVNTMFAVTEASGIADDTYTAIEGNLQGNSRLLLVFNPNKKVGYAAKSQKGNRFVKFRLNSLTAPNVVEKRIVIPGQVDYNWVKDKVDTWCQPIRVDEVLESEDDFEFEGQWYRPDDNARKKVLGCFPKVDADALIPQQWIEAAQARWVAYHKTKRVEQYPGLLRIGVDVAGEGRDSSAFVYRHGNIVREIYKYNSGGKADHVALAGRITADLRNDPKAMAFVDTIGEGAGVVSITNDNKLADRAISCKFSEAAKDHSGKLLTDMTGLRNFYNMRAYLFWCVRDWLDPFNKQDAMLPPGDTFAEEATEIMWSYKGNSMIAIEPKDDIKSRLGRSIDEFDALANTFCPAQLPVTQNAANYFA